MENFFIDRLGEEHIDKLKETHSESKNNDNYDLLNCQEINLFDELPDHLKLKDYKSRSRDEISLNNTYLISNYKCLDAGKKCLSQVDKLLEKSVISKGLEKQMYVPMQKSKKVLRLERKKLREKTKGEKWFNMPATELTEEIKTDFELLKMRSVLDRKHVYKKNDITHMPKYFQVGKVVENAADFYGGRIPKSHRKKTMVDELLADAEFKKYQKKKFKEIMDDNRRKKRSNKNLGNIKFQKKGKSKK